jgi:hypothetical protein
MESSFKGGFFAKKLDIVMNLREGRIQACRAIERIRMAI